jgi:hypothetical protein
MRVIDIHHHLWELHHLADVDSSDEFRPVQPSAASTTLFQEGPRSARARDTAP